MIKTIVTENNFTYTFEPVKDSINIKETPEGYTVKYLSRDNDAESPREWDNLGKMICFHKQYNLGDKLDIHSSDFNSWDELKKYLFDNGAVVVLPMYMYDHSGITIATKPFSCPWDSGQIGYVFANRNDILKEYSVKRITKNIIKKVADVLNGEVEVYDMYLTGDVYGVTTETYDKDKHQITEDSCWGHFGYKNTLNDMIEEE